MCYGSYLALEDSFVWKYLQRQALMRKILLPMATVTSVNALVNKVLELEETYSAQAGVGALSRPLQKKMAELARKRLALARELALATQGLGSEAGAGMIALEPRQHWSRTERPSDALRVITWVGCLDVTFEEVRKGDIVTVTATQQDFYEWAARVGARPVSLA